MSLPSNTGYSGSDKDEWGSLAGLPSPAPHHGFLLSFLLFLRSKRATLLGQTAIINCAWPQRLRTGERGNAKPSIRGHHTQERAPLAQ